jgi:hypothetical protein
MTCAGFESITEEVVEHGYSITDAAPYRARVFSALLRISDEAFARGLARLEADLRKGPVRGVRALRVSLGIEGVASGGSLMRRSVNR